jgi:hypothetical protein
MTEWTSRPDWLEGRKLRADLREKERERERREILNFFLKFGSELESLLSYLFVSRAP